MPSSIPTLTPTIISSDDLLAHAVDDLVHHDRSASAVQVEVLRLQADLRELVGPDGWAAYLQVEAAVNAKWSELALVLVRWAFEQGVKFTAERPP
jgi:hypothetical protein